MKDGNEIANILKKVNITVIFEELRILNHVRTRILCNEADYCKTSVWNGNSIFDRSVYQVSVYEALFIQLFDLIYCNRASNTFHCNDSKIRTVEMERMRSIKSYTYNSIIHSLMTHIIF